MLLYINTQRWGQGKRRKTCQDATHSLPLDVLFLFTPYIFTSCESVLNIALPLVSLKG